MNKNCCYNKLKNELIKRSTVSFEGIISTSDNTITREESSGGDPNTFIMQLKISTNTVSPIQRSSFGSWNEIIRDDCFDESLGNELFCFLDHKIDIEHTLASTRNNTMQVWKDKNAYIANVLLNRQNPQHQVVIDKLETGLLNANSFIFEPLESEYNESYYEGEPIITVTHTRGRLISIDPVVLPFYPTNTINFKEEPMENIEKREMPAEVAKEEEKEKTENTEEVAVDKEKVEEKTEEVFIQDAPINELAEAEKSADFWKAKYIELLEAKETSAEIKNDDSKPNEETEEQNKNIDGEKIKAEFEPKSADPESEILKERSKIKETIKKMSDTNIRKITFKELESRMNKPTGAAFGNANKLFNEEEKIALRSYVDNLERNHPMAMIEANLIANSPISRAAIDGTNTDQGLAFISYINDPEVKTELEKTLPEINGADGISLDTLDIVKKDILIPNSGAVNPIAEGASSVEFNGTTVSIPFKPIRYSQEYKVNPKLPNFTQIMEKNTLNGKSSIVNAVRKAFYDNLFSKAGDAWGTAKATWEGGIVKDSLVSAGQATTLSISDLDNIISRLEAVYGDNVQTHFRALMHPDTKTYLMKEARDLKNPDWVIEKNQTTYRGIPITTSTHYKYKVNPVTGAGTADEIPIVLVRKDCIVYRGLTFVTEDNPYIDMSKGLATRYQHTRGEIKLIDPFLNTIAIKFGAVTRAASITPEELDAYEDVEQIKKAYDIENFDKKSKKLLEAKIEELKNKTNEN